MSKQTAVEWLEKEMSFVAQFMRYPNVREAFLDAFNQAKQMEKEQVQNAFDEGVDWHRDYFGKQKGMVKNLPETYGGDHE
jgi:hypothetical protein